MIENLRKYTVLLTVLFVLVIIGFIFMDTSSMRAAGGGKPYIKVNGKSYSDKEYRRLGPASYDLTRTMASGGDLQMYRFIAALSGNNQSQELIHDNFFANRMILRAAKEEFGIYPAETEIDSFIRKLAIFAGPDGAFSQQTYRNIIEQGIGRMGLTESDIRELAQDVLIFDKISQILGSGLSEDPRVVEKRSAIEKQRIKLNLARIDRDPIEAKIEPTEEEIKAFWETVQDAYKTEEKRQFTYFIAKPETPAEPAPIEPLPEAATEEQKTEHTKKVTERDAAIAEAKRVARVNVGGKVDELLYKLETQPTLSFANLAAEQSWELVTTELFTVNEAPEALKQNLRSARSQGSAAQYLFSIEPTEDPFSKIAHSGIGENEYLVAHLDKTEPSRVKTYEEARADARAQLISEKADAAIKENANKASEAIKASLAEGKTFAEAATAAGIETPVLSLPDVTAAFQPAEGQQTPTNLFQAAQYTSPGKLTEPVIESDRAFIIHVESREVEKSETAAAELAGRVQQAASGNRYAAFSSWLNDRYEAAKVQPLNR